jgi:hypothetical protein
MTWLGRFKWIAVGNPATLRSRLWRAVRVGIGIGILLLQGLPWSRAPLSPGESLTVLIVHLAVVALALWLVIGAFRRPKVR